MSRYTPAIRVRPTRFNCDSVAECSSCAWHEWHRATLCNYYIVDFYHFLCNIHHMVGSRGQLSLWGSIWVLVCFTLSDRSTVKNAIVCNLKGNLSNYSHSIVFVLSRIPSRLSCSFFSLHFLFVPRETVTHRVMQMFIIHVHHWALHVHLKLNSTIWKNNRHEILAFFSPEQVRQKYLPFVRTTRFEKAI